MLGRIVEIEGEGRRLSLDRGFLTVAGPDGPLGKVPLDDIEAVILSNPAASFTSQIIAALAQRGAPLVVCGNDFRPAAFLLPVDGHHAQGDRMEAQAESTLRDLAAQNGGRHFGTALTYNPLNSDSQYRDIAAAQFSAVTHENEMKWEALEPQQGQYNWSQADSIINFAKANNQIVRGHTLVWHNQNPSWLTESAFTPAELRQILRDHIKTQVRHFKGRVYQWDVVNEVFNDDGTPRDTIWLRALGPGYIADAFRWAHEADPAAVLYLNDYGIEQPGPKADAYYELARQLLAEGVPLGGMGFQGHLSFDYPYPSGLQQNLQRFADLGLEVAITELDVRMPVDPAPGVELQEEQARWFADVLDACLKVSRCESVTLWGTNDRYSWVPSVFPGEGFATPWNDDSTRKPAYKSLLDRLSAGR